jgi:hypothetical protein
VPSPAAQRVTALFLIGERADRAVAAFQTVGPLTCELTLNPEHVDGVHRALGGRWHL